MLGENGTGKTTFIRMLAGLPGMEPDAPEDGSAVGEITGFTVSYKPQKISPSFEGSVRALLMAKIREMEGHPQFRSEVMKPLNIEAIIDQEVKNLSGGELQRVALCLCLGKPADVFLIDEPSAYLDSEQRITAAKIIKRYVLHTKKTAFIVEHDFIMATYLADRVIVYEGSPGVDCTANTPQSLLTGMNAFLKVRGGGGELRERSPRLRSPRLQPHAPVLVRHERQQRRVGQAAIGLARRLDQRQRGRQDALAHVGAVRGRAHVQALFHHVAGHAQVQHLAQAADAFQPQQFSTQASS
jgi:translation initiation factor RLI1